MSHILVLDIPTPTLALTTEDSTNIDINEDRFAYFPCIAYVI